MRLNPNARVSSVQSSFIGSLGEWFFALFLFAGNYKNDPRFAFIQAHIDITLLFLILSFFMFLYNMLRNALTKKISLSFTKAATLFLLLTVSLIVGLLYTQSREYGFDKVLRFIFLTGWSFFGASLLISDFFSLRRFSWAIVIISMIMAIDASLSYPGVGQINFVTAFGSNYIALARTTGLGFLTTVGFLLPTERRLLMRVFLWVIGTLQLWAALIAGTRGPVLALILSIFLFFAFSVQNFKIDRFALRLSSIGLPIIVVLTVMARKFFATLVYRLEILITEVGPSGLTRLSLYQAALDLWAKSPIWGNGTGQFGIAVLGQDVRNYPHNIILELGAENGLIGVLIFVLLIVVAFSKGFISLYNGRGIAKTVARYLIVACCFTLFNAMVSGDINDNRMLFSWLALMAALSTSFTIIPVTKGVPFRKEIGVNNSESKKLNE